MIISGLDSASKDIQKEFSKVVRQVYGTKVLCINAAELCSGLNGVVLYHYPLKLSRYMCGILLHLHHCQTWTCH